jgi:hypothetical protein
VNKWQKRDRKLRRRNRRDQETAKVHLGTNRFHIYAKYRFPNLKTVPENITMINIDKHRDYHQLFGLRIPAEILRYLNRYFWGGLFILKIEEEENDCLDLF